jgi:hypothetical protein
LPSFKNRSEEMQMQNGISAPAFWSNVVKEIASVCKVPEYWSDDRFFSDILVSLDITMVPLRMQNL